MSHHLRKVFLFLIASAVVAAETAVASSERGPALPLPDPSPEEIALENWSSDEPLPNSVRAWHYNPAIVQPLMEIGGAVQDTVLSYTTRQMLATIVASRNHCLY